MAKFMGWIDERFPATKVWEEHVSKSVSYTHLTLPTKA